MSVKIRMKRLGAAKRPFYRIVVADSRRSTRGRFIEELGFYNPISNPRMFSVDADKANAWMSDGARPSKTVARLFKEYGVYDAEGLVQKGLDEESRRAVQEAKEKERAKREAEEEKIQQEEIAKEQAAAEKAAAEAAAAEEAAKAEEAEEAEEENEAEAEEASADEGEEKEEAPAEDSEN